MDLHERIIRTVCYFDLFDYPLTRAEIRRWLFGGDWEPENARSAFSFGDVDRAIGALVAARALKENGGFIQLADRVNNLSATRETRYRHSCRKWRRARRWARIFAAMPGIELVGVGNTLAYHNAKDDSDIDFFIVTEPGTIWRSRFFCAALAAIFNLRPRPGDNRDKLCLSFFAASDSLDISVIAKNAAAAATEQSTSWRDDGKNMRTDVYLRYWIGQMMPLYGSESAAARYRVANKATEDRSVIAPAPRLWQALLLPLVLLPGNFAHRWQERRFPENLRRGLEKNDGSVTVSDHVLKFHVSDRRRDIYEKWEKRVESILHEGLQNRRPN